MKKLFLSILLLCCCIVFTGCGGNSNSYDDAYRITVSKKVVDTYQGITSARAVADERKNVDFYLNGVEFPGHSFDTDGNYIFTKVMYDQEAQDILLGASTTLSLSIDGLKLTLDIEKVTDLNAGIFWDKQSDGSYIVMNGNVRKTIIRINGDSLVDLNEITKVEISKLSSLSAKVVFKNILNETQKLDFDSWKISALDSNLEPIHFWTSEKDASDKKLDISFVNNITEKYYTINLTSQGVSAAGSHNLDNTIVKIDYIRKGGLDVVDTGILEQATWQPNK